MFILKDPVFSVAGNDEKRNFWKVPTISPVMSAWVHGTWTHQDPLTILLPSSVTLGKKVNLSCLCCSTIKWA